MYSDHERWSAVDAYFGDKLAPQDDALKQALAANVAAGMFPFDGNAVVIASGGKPSRGAPASALSPVGWLRPNETLRISLGSQ